MNRETLRRRISALRDKTTARGCTEAEAMTAASKAAELMREYGLSDHDIVMDRHSVPSKTAGHSARDIVWRTLSYCTNTAVMIDWVDGQAVRIFIGEDPGPAIASYLYVVCDRAIDREIATFKATTFYKRRRNLSTRRQAVADFTTGLANRLCAKLRALFADTISKDAHGRAVAARDALFPDSKKISARSRPETRFRDAASSGWTAGGNVELSHGVNGASGDPYLLTGGEQ